MADSNRLDQLLELTGNISNAFTIALYKVNSENKTLFLRHHISLSSNFNTEAKIDFGEGLIGTVAQNKQPFIQEHFEKNPIRLCQYSKKEVLKSFLAIPVIHKNLEGVLFIDSKESYCFPAKQQKIIAGLAKQLAWELNKEKTNALSDSPKKFIFRDLVSYSRFVSESSNKNKALERLTNIPRSILTFDAHALVWFDSRKTGKVLKFNGFSQSVTNVSIKLGKGLAGSCAKNLCPILLSNTEGRNGTIFGVEEDKEQSFLSLMASPISFNQQFYGVMVCGSKTAGHFSNLDLDTLTLITYSAGSSIFNAKTKEQWNHNKNIDQIVGIPNHRFLTQHSDALKKDFLKNGKSTCFLSLKIKNLSELYSSFGIKCGDLFQRGIASTLSSILPSPKYIFKFSDAIYIVILVDQKWSDVQPFKLKLETVLSSAPLFVEGIAMDVHAKLGMSCFPDDGKTISQLIGASLHNENLKTLSKNIINL
jgi:diguanylate cyclase (GGDEF)-like protein